MTTAQRKKNSLTKNAKSTATLTKLNHSLVKSLVGARVCYCGLDAESCGMSAKIVGGDSLVAMIEDKSHGTVLARWDEVAVYMNEVLKRM